VKIKIHFLIFDYRIKKLIITLIKFSLKAKILWCEMKRLLLLFFTISLFTLAVNTVNAATNVSDCGTLNSENTTYQLNQSINSSFDCIIINATNITLDCAGYNITYGNETGGYGVANVNEDTGTGYNNVTVKNCVIIQNQSGFGERAIHFGANSETGLIENNTITVYGNDTSGILMGDNSIDGVIFNNTIISYGNLSFMDGMGGIFLETETSGMNVSSNNITTSGIYGTGIWVWGSNHSVDNNNITTSGEAGDGIYLGDVLGVNLSSNILTISGNVSYGIYSEMSENSSLLFYNNVITTSANHSDGIHLRGNNYNNISSNNITTSGYDSFGVYFNQSHNITLSNNIIKTGKSDSYVLCLLTSSNVTFYNNIFNASTSGSGVNITNSDLSYFNTTNSSATNIVGKSYIGGNFWTNTQGNGYSDLCTNLDSDYFCDSAYNIVTASNDNRDYLPLTTHTGFKFTGTVMDVNGSSLNNSVINISIYSMSGGPPTVVGYNTTTSNATGYFSLVVAGNATSNLMYKLVITHTNTTNNYVDYVGQTLPIFPYSEFSRLSNINFYLKEAGTISITAINSTDDLVPFGYMIKDTKLGYEISMDINTSSSGALVYVPKDRNYSREH